MNNEKNLERICFNCNYFFPSSNEATKYGICLEDDDFKPYLKDILEYMDYSSCQLLVDSKKFPGEQDACEKFEEAEFKEIIDPELEKELIYLSQSRQTVEEDRILIYVTGLLYYYGVMDFESLYSAVVYNLDIELEREAFKSLLEEETCKEDSYYEFDFKNDFGIHFEVEDPKWVLEEQGKRPVISYRPVTEEEALQVVNWDHFSLWHESAAKLFQQLQDKYGWSNEDALEMVLDCQEMLRNNALPTDIVQEFLGEMSFQELDEVQPFIDMVMDMANNTHLWILKGWAPREVRERFENTSSEDSENTSPGVKENQVGTREIGRNELCPCGSGKKYKKCCGGNDYGAGEGFTESREDIDHTRDPTLEEWRSLYEAASVFKKNKCWEWMNEEDIFGVKDPETGEIAYCSIMGALGEYFALGAHLGGEGLEVLLDFLEAETEEEIINLWFMQRCLVASFENREDLQDKDRGVIKELGLRFRGKKQWPLFRSHEPGYYPWFLNAWECRFLTDILQQAIQVSMRCQKDKSFLVQVEDPRIFVRVPQGKREQVKWIDQYIKPSREAKKYLTVVIKDELKVKRILDSAEKSREVWEADTFWKISPVQEKKGERPFYPKTFMLVSTETGLILTFELLKNLDEEGHLCVEALLRLVEKRDVIPASICVAQQETYYLLEDACRRLGISLQKVNRLDFIPGIREEILDEGL